MAPNSRRSHGLSNYGSRARSISSFGGSAASLDDNRLMRQAIVILVSAVCGGLIGALLWPHGQHPYRTEGRNHERPVSVVVDSDNHGCRCGAGYYGLGNGDGVYDPRCFKLQEELSTAARAGDVDRIRELLRLGANADSYSGDSFPPLYTAASYGRTNAVRLFLDNGAYINHVYSLMGTPLMAAAYEGRVGTVELLLSRGADPSICLGDDSALSIARKEHHTAIVELLASAGASECPKK